MTDKGYMVKADHASLTRAQIEELYSLRHNQALIKFLQGKLAKAKDDLVVVDDANTFRYLQGVAQAYRQLLKAIDPESAV